MLLHGCQQGRHGPGAGHDRDRQRHHRDRFLDLRLGELARSTALARVGSGDLPVKSTPSATVRL